MPGSRKSGNETKVPVQALRQGLPLALPLGVPSRLGSYCWIVVLVFEAAATHPEAFWGQTTM